MSVTSFLESRQRTCNPHGVCEGRSEAAASGSVLVTTDVPGQQPNFVIRQRERGRHFARERLASEAWIGRTIERCHRALTARWL